jgi:hypothetical protein
LIAHCDRAADGASGECGNKSQRVTVRDGANESAISAIIFLMMARPKELKFSATRTNAPGPADDVVLVVFLEPAGRIGVLGVPRHRAGR